MYVDNFFIKKILIHHNISLQVKRSIMLKMADACQEANKHKQTTFQEMYVQRHNNVRYVIKIYNPFL